MTTIPSSAGIPQITEEQLFAIKNCFRTLCFKEYLFWRNPLADAPIKQLFLDVKLSNGFYLLSTEYTGVEKISESLYQFFT